MKDKFEISKDLYISRLELLDLISPIDTTMLSDNKMFQVATIMDLLFPNIDFSDESKSYKWWEELESLLIKDFNCKYYEDYSDKERKLADERINLIKANFKPIIYEK